MVVTRRERYIAFRLAPRAARSDLVRELTRDRVRLVEWNGRCGIVSCPHTAKEATIALLRGAGAETLGTSGTIRRCRAKFLSGGAQ